MSLHFYAYCIKKIKQKFVIKFTKNKKLKETTIEGGVVENVCVTVLSR